MVVTQDRAALVELCEVQRVIEQRAVELALLGLGPVELGEMTDAFATMSKAHDGGDALLFVQAMRRFHLTLVGAGVGRRHRALIAELWDEAIVSRLRHCVDGWRRLGELADHDLMLRATRTRDAAALALLIEVRRHSLASIGDRTPAAVGVP